MQKKSYFSRWAVDMRKENIPQYWVKIKDREWKEQSLQNVIWNYKLWESSQTTACHL